MSILGTTTNYTVTITAPTCADDPFEFVQGAHFMQLLMAQLRPQNPLATKKRQDVLEQLTRMTLLQEISETSPPVNAAGPAGKTAAFPEEDGKS